MQPVDRADAKVMSINLKSTSCLVILAMLISIPFKFLSIPAFYLM
jgi:hypothetical protein